MKINRYTNPVISRYNPMSMQELAFTPSMLRQRHDEAQQSVGLLESEFGNYDVLDNYLGVAEELVNPLRQNAQQLSEDLATQGINRSQGTGRAMKLASEYKNTFGPTGGIGQLQSATKNFRAEQQAINEFFKDSPELARYKSSQLKPGEATLKDGKVQLGQSSVPSYVKDIPQDKILDRLSKAVSGLKASDFGDYGLTGMQGLNDFTRLATLASGKGLEAERAMNLMTSLLSNEEKASIAQRGELYGLDPETSLNQFGQQLGGIAQASAYHDVSRSRMQIKNDMGLYRAKQALDEANNEIIPFIAPSGRISSDNINPYSKLNLNGVKAGQEIYINSNGQEVPVTEATELKFLFPGMPGSRVLKEGYTSQQGESPAHNALMNSFKTLKENLPQLKGLSDEQALVKINDYYENLTQRYSTTMKGDLNSKALAESVIGMSLHVSVWGNEGKGGTLDDTLKKLGYSDYNDFVKNGANAFKGLTSFGPDGKPAYEFTTTDSKGKRNSMFVEADVVTQNLSERSTGMNKMILNGQTSSGSFQDLYVNYEGQLLKLQGVDINPIASNALPYTIGILNFKGTIGISPELVSRLEGLPPEEVKQVMSGFGAVENRDYFIKDFNKTIEEESKMILDYQQKLKNQSK